MIRVLISIFLLIGSAHAAIYYVVNSLDESLGWVDPGTGEFDSQAVTVGNLANDVVVTNNRLYVVNSGLGTLQIIDRNTLLTIDEIEIAGAANPYSAAALDDARIAVTGWLSGSLSIVNVESMQTDTSFATGISPQAVMTYDGMIYVLNTGVEFPSYTPGVLKRYDSQTYSLIDTLAVGINPQSMVIIGDELHVLCTGNYDDIRGSVAIVDQESLSIEQTLQLGGSPGAIAAHGDDVFVAAGGWEDVGYVYHYNAATREVQNDADNPIFCGAGASDIAVLPDGSFAVTCLVAATIEFCTADGAVCTSFEMSSGAGALGVWWGPSDVEIEPSVVHSSEVLQAYPNPFNGEVSLRWDGDSQQTTTVAIVDVVGRNVARLTGAPGGNGVIWRPGALGATEVSAGVYFARIERGQVTQPIRIVYIK